MSDGCDLAVVPGEFRTLVSADRDLGQPAVIPQIKDRRLRDAGHR
jgi:hypothetical protein